MVVLAATALVVLVLLSVLVGLRGPTGQPRLGAAAALPEATGRPFEVVSLDVHRLGRQFHYLPRGVSFARYEGRRRAYDAVLAEACRALAIEHLLTVLPVGPELDAERHRVEVRLGFAGMSLDA